ncbi:AI-2E family transporter [Chitinasiproducens palmae]|uniref:Predicted PurR-regulated permease PerM n=1 Tax=Chitinasiproducens palmae TaxID=1770053 RepID=A0A1H2PMR6_9BURK|nr:AI-2E family transporter [Chitinasiproducens palmae]SDV47779.1 Predicted PurR-regulated permease PerM [Chitinasiproducens palmae]
MNDRSLNQKSFHILLALVTIAFIWTLYPFFGAVFWGAILAIIFQPMQRWLTRRFKGRQNLAALTTLLIILLIVILPLALVGVTLVQEASLVYQRIKGGQIDFAGYYQSALHMLPSALQRMLASFGLTDIGALQERLTAGAARISQYLAAQALSIGQNTFQFVVSFGVMLYLVFFLLRDGREIGGRIRRAIPLDEEHKTHLLRKFTTVVRATVKGNIVVAAAQGLLGGIIFAILGIQGSVLWGVLMAFLSLLPAIGAALIWAPAAVFFLMTGAVWKGVVLILFCVFVIGLVDNVLRPILVGKDTKLPDWVVLIATLGGMALFGIDGFVIGPLIAALFISSWALFSHQGERTEDAGGEPK